MEFFLRKLEEFQDWTCGINMVCTVRCRKLFVNRQRDIGDLTAE